MKYNTSKQEWEYDTISYNMLDQETVQQEDITNKVKSEKLKVKS